MGESINGKKLCEFPVWIGNVMKAIHKRQIEVLKPYGLANIHTNYLMTLFYHREGLTLMELTEQLMVDKANTSRAIRSLEELGYVYRIYPKDKVMKYKVCLTPEGQKAAEEIGKDMKQVHDILVSDLTEQERQTIRVVMQKISKAADNIEKRTGGVNT